MQTVALQTGKWYSKDEMIAAGAGGHLSRAILKLIPVDQIDGLEPTPSGDYAEGREITNPIEVVHDRDQGKYMLYAGNHRVTQAKMNGDETILAFVETPRRRASKEEEEGPDHFFVSPNLTGLGGEQGREFDSVDPCINCVVPHESEKGREASADYDRDLVPGLSDAIAKKYGIKFIAFEGSHRIELMAIEVPKELRGQGIGSAAIEEFKQAVRGIGKPVVLHPEADRGKKKKLLKFYKSLGFVENKGRNQDYSISSPHGPTMFWRPEDAARKARIARGIQAIMEPGRMPDPTELEDLPETKQVGRNSEVTFDFTTSDGVDYFVHFKRSDFSGEQQKNWWEASFGEYGPNGEMLIDPYKPSKKKVEVLETVAVKIKDFIDNWNPAVLIFNPSSDSRLTVYVTMLRRFLPDAKIDAESGGIWIDLREGLPEEEEEDYYEEGNYQDEDHDYAGAYDDEYEDY